MSKHTPGPWRVYNGWVHPSFDNPGPQMTNGDTAICEPLGQDKSANARLIAAAPELLEAVQYALDVSAEGLRLGEEWQILARAAIAKAKGE